MKSFLLVVGMLAGLVLTGASAQATTADPTTLPRGDDAHLTWLGGLTLHPSTGPTMHVPLPRDHAATVKLLGPAAGGGWVLADARGDRKVVLMLRGHRLTMVRSVSDPQDGTSFLLSSDGTHVVEVDAPTTRRTDVWTFDLAGRDRRHLRRPGYLTLLGYDGTTVHLTSSGRTIAWRPGSAPVVIARASGLAVDVPHDTLFTWDPGPGTYGPTALSAPGTQTWSLPAGDFYPRKVSPDGAYVVGLGGHSNDLQVRLMSDGSLVADWNRHLAFERPLLWENAGHVVSVLRTRRGRALLRCTVAADCVRTTRPSGDPVSLPFQEVSFSS